MDSYYGSEWYFFVHEHFTLDEVMHYRNFVIALQRLYSTA